MSHPIGDRFVGFELGGAELALYPLDALAEEANLSPEPGTERFAGFTCAINVESQDSGGFTSVP